MDQGAHRGRRLHRVGKPGLERELGRLGGGGDQEPEGHPGQRVRPQLGRVLQEGVDLVAPEEREDHQRPAQQAHAADLGHQQGLDAGRDRLGVVIVVGDEGIGAEGRDLPEEEQEEHVVGQHQADHGPDEKQDLAVIAAELWIAVHVRHGEDDRQAPDDRGHGRQEDSQAVRHERHVAEEAADRQPQGNAAPGAGDQCQ